MVRLDLYCDNIQIIELNDINGFNAFNGQT